MRRLGALPGRWGRRGSVGGASGERREKRGLRQGWEGRDQRERCEARERSGPLNSLAPARNEVQGRGAAQIIDQFSGWPAFLEKVN